MSKWHGQKCGGCYHAERVPKDTNLMRRECRGAPPMIVMMVANTPRGPAQIAQAMFPPVEVTDKACGAWEPRELSIEGLEALPVQDNEPPGAA